MPVDSLWGNIFKNESSNEESIFSMLSRVPIFAELKQRELKEIERIAHRRRFKADEIIFWEGEPGVGMYIIQKGSVLIFKDKKDGGREKLALLKSGEFFGELALLDESPRSATAIAQEETEIIGIFRPDLFGLLQRKPRLGVKLALKLASMIGERLRKTNEDLRNLKNQLEKTEMVS